MLIGLHDADTEQIKNKQFPNLALMKISAWHKRQGDTVEWWLPLKNAMYNLVYSSKIFDFTPSNPYLPEKTIKGGTGYDIKKTLPDYMDNIEPDYSIYPGCDYAIGFLTRGCINNCSWCYVPDKEGYIREYRAWQQIVRKDTDKLVLMDNNILACKWGIEQLYSLSDTEIKIDLNQGMDIRLVTEDIVKLFRKIKWIKYIRFSCDSVGQIPYFEKVVGWFNKYGIGLSKVFVYVIVRKNIEDAEYRVKTLFNLNKNINIYCQAERNGGKDIVPNKLQLEFCQRYAYGRVYKTESWSEYCTKRNIEQNTVSESDTR